MASASERANGIQDIYKCFTHTSPPFKLGSTYGILHCQRERPDVRPKPQINREDLRRS